MPIVLFAYTNRRRSHHERLDGITKELATGKFTDEMLADMRALIGTELRTEACVNNEYATRLAILRFCEGIGDDNPLWTDADYAAKTPHGTLIAPPSFIFACLGVGAGRLARPRRLPRRDQDDLPQARSASATRSRAAWSSTASTARSRQQFRRPPHQGLHAPGVPQPGRRAGGRRSSARACASSAREMQKRAASRARSSCRIRGPRRSSPRSRSDDPGREAARRDPALLGRRAGRRRDRRHHQGAARADRLHRLHRRRRGADPARRGPSVCAASAIASIRSGRSATRGRMRSSRCTRCTTTTMRPSCRARRSPTTSASSAPAGRSTR